MDTPSVDTAPGDVERWMIEWATEEARLYEEAEVAKWLPVDDQGTEHLVTLIDQAQLVIKRGHHYQGVDWVTYLNRILLSNEHFDDLIELHGVVLDEGGRSQPLISQPWVPGEIPQSEDLNAVLHRAGWESIGLAGMFEQKPFMIADGKPDNWRVAESLEGDRVFMPIDIQIGCSETGEALLEPCDKGEPRTPVVEAAIVGVAQALRESVIGDYEETLRLLRICGAEWFAEYWPEIEAAIPGD